MERVYLAAVREGGLTREMYVGAVGEAAARALLEARGHTVVSLEFVVAEDVPEGARVVRASPKPAGRRAERTAIGGMIGEDSWAIAKGVALGVIIGVVVLWVLSFLIGLVGIGLLWAGGR